MLTRRVAVQVGAAAGLARATGLAWAETPVLKTRLTFTVPTGATDCHVHVFPDPVRYPMAAGRTYTPPEATAADLLALQQAMGFDRVVIVTPSVYGTDNSAMLDAVRQLGPARARGVAVIDASFSAAALDGLKAAGVTGIRLNLETAGVFDPALAAAKLDSAVRQIEGRGWHLEIYSRLPVIEAMKDRLGSLPVPVVFDHFGSARPTEGVDQPGFATLLSLVRSGRAYVTLSGAYIISRAAGYADVKPLAQALLAANGERLLWGSNWPHPNSDPVPGRKPTDIAPAQDIDNGAILNLLADWAPDEGTRKRILVDNPQRLYGF